MKDLIFSDVDNYLALRGRNLATVGLTKRMFTVVSPRMLPVLFARLSTSSIPVLNRLFSLMNVLLFGIEVNSQCKIGKGIFFPHTSGIVVGARIVGDNCIIYQGVTLGAKSLDFSNSDDNRPTIGNNVTIGAGAKVLGGIHIGDNVIIGANTVVTKSIPKGKTVIGAKAEIVGCKDEQQ